MKALKKLFRKGSRAESSSASPAPSADGKAPKPAAPLPKPSAPPPEPLVREGSGKLATAPSGASVASGTSSSAPSAPRQCANACGWTAFGPYAKCCKSCVCPAGPHSKDCPLKNSPWVPLCALGCQRPAFGSFVTCCTRCQGPDGPHARSCDVKSGKRPAGGGVCAPVPVAAPKTADEVLEDLRRRLVEWQRAGAMTTRAQVDEVISTLAASSGMEAAAVRVLWHTVVRQARPVGAPVEVYVALARKHHAVEVEVIDLGAQSAKHTNSCMFLTCSAAIVERRSRGIGDELPPGVLGEALAAAAPDSNAAMSVDEIIEQHRRTRAGTLGRMADALRHAACEMLASDADFFRPYFSPVRGMMDEGEEAQAKAYNDWVERLRGSEEGDELVILAVSRLLGMAVQPVQQSGYRVPLMDPTAVGDGGYVSYWGNDDKHWVWLRLLGPATGADAEADASVAEAAPSVGEVAAAAAAAAAAPAAEAAEETEAAPAVEGPAAMPAPSAPPPAEVEAAAEAAEGKYPIGLF